MATKPTLSGDALDREIDRPLAVHPEQPSPGRQAVQFAKRARRLGLPGTKHVAGRRRSAA